MDASQHKQWRNQQPAKSARFGAFTVLELLVVIMVIGALIALLMPALMFSRESARRIVCVSHLREIGIAIHHHHDSHRQLPRAWRIAGHDSHFGYGWAAQLLPELEEQTVYQKIDFNQAPRFLDTTKGGATLSLAIMICPSDITQVSFGLVEDQDDEADDIGPARSSLASARPRPRHLMVLPTANYVGVYGTVEADDFFEFHGSRGTQFGDGSVIHDRRVRFADLRRGLSNTLLVGERTMATVPSTWLGVDLRGEDAPCRLVGSAMTRPNCNQCDECEFTSRHTAGSNFLWADSHVTLVGNSVEPGLYREFARRTTH